MLIMCRQYHCPNLIGRSIGKNTIKVKIHEHHYCSTRVYMRIDKAYSLLCASPLSWNFGVETRNMLICLFSLLGRKQDLSLNLYVEYSVYSNSKLYLSDDSRVSIIVIEQKIRSYTSGDLMSVNKIRSVLS